MMVVTGANGKLGQAIVEQLLQTQPAHRLGVSVRDPGQAAALAQRGVRVRRGDFAEPDSLAQAFEGASQLLLVSSNASASGLDVLAQHRAAIAAAQAAGVQRIVYTSHMGAGVSSEFPPMRSHAATEAMLGASGLAWTALRHGFYASTLPIVIGNAVATGVLAAPADGKVSWTAHADLAAAAAAVLAAEGRFDGPTPALTAGEALDLDDVAALLSELHGKRIQRQVVPDAEYATRLAERGVPATLIDITMGMYRASRKAEFAAVDPRWPRWSAMSPCRFERSSPRLARPSVQGSRERGGFARTMTLHPGQPLAAVPPPEPDVVPVNSVCRPRSLLSKDRARRAAGRTVRGAGSGVRDRCRLADAAAG